MLPISTTSTGRTPIDAAQRAVVDHQEGVLLALGGPGTGKTTALAERFARLALEESSPDRVLFLVPNRTQKIGVQDRLTRRLLFDAGLEAVVEVPVYTWHGFAYHLVSRHYDRLAYSEPPVLLTSPEQWGAVRDALAGEPDADWPRHKHLLRNRGFVDEVVDFFTRCEQRLLEPSDLERIVEQRPAWADLVRFFKAHRERLRARSRVDYPTLLGDAAELIANHDDVRESLRRRFTHVLVDDGQELAFVQQRLLRFLTGAPGDPDASAGRSLVVAADADSAIEHFRGADPAWLSSIEGLLGAVSKVTLPTSYRLGPDAGERAGALIAENGPSSDRPSAFAGTTTLEVRRFANLAAELDAVARELRLAHLKKGIPYDRMAVLLTSPRSMLPPLERALQALEVPYSISAPDRPLEREPAVRTFCELARFVFDDDGDPDRLAELLRSPLVGLDMQELRGLERDALAFRVELADHVAALASGADADPRLRHLFDLRASLLEHRTSPADDAFWAIWQSARHYRDLEDRARRSLDDPANRELDALVVFGRSLGRFVERRRGRGTLEQYLDAITRADFGSDPWLPPERRSGGVEVLSFHAAKGKEWDLVAVTGCVEGMIPKGRRAQGLFDPFFLDDVDPLERLVRNEQEDRRVLYVAVTRARERCIVTTSPGPSRKGQPSRFLIELAGSLPEPERSAELPPLTFSEAAARLRRTLTDTGRPATERLAALVAVADICKLDPGCGAAQPAEWWWRWDWTEGAVAINDQSFRDEDVGANKIRTSYSRLTHYDNCPLAYLYGVVLGLDPEITHNLHFGRWIHEIIEDCEKEPTEDERRSGRRRLTNPAMVFERYAEIFDEGVFPSKPIARQFRRDGETMLQNYIDHMKPGSALLVEHGFRLEVDGHVIRGRIDRVDRKGKNLVVADYKTSRNEASWEEAKDSLQLAIYYKAATEDPELVALGEPCSMQLIYPAFVKRNDLSRRYQDPKDAEKVLERLPRLLEGIVAEDFRPAPDANCRWCKFKPLCPLWPEGKELPA